MQLTDEEALEKFLCEDDLYYFVRKAWPYIDPAEYIKDWYHQDICYHLEAVFYGDILRLLINIPPRSLKSLICSVFYPVWAWIKKPTEIFLTGSNSLSLATRDAMKARTLMESHWFKRLWGDVIQFKDDQNQKSKYYNTAMGLRQAFSMSSSFIGEGADQIIIDDAMSYTQVLSKMVREEIIDRHNQAVSTRFNNSKTGREIVIGQRLHTDDLPGHLLKNNPEFYHLCIPMRYEVDSAYSYSDDPRTKEGEILTNMHTEKSLSKLEKTMGANAVAGQFQQRPSPKGGLIFKRSWFNYYRELPTVLRWVSSWDTAISEKKTADYSVGGLFAQCENGYYLVKLFRDKVGFAQLLKEFKLFYEQQPVSAALVEAKASGQQLIQMLESSDDVHIPVISINPQGDKVFRAELASATVEAGKMYLPENAPWLSDVIDELTLFPNTTNNDIVDIVTQFINWCNSNAANRVRIYSL